MAASFAVSGELVAHESALSTGSTSPPTFPPPPAGALATASARASSSTSPSESENGSIPGSGSNAISRLLRSVSHSSGGNAVAESTIASARSGPIDGLRPPSLASPRTAVVLALIGRGSVLQLQVLGRCVVGLVPLGFDDKKAPTNVCHVGQFRNAISGSCFFSLPRLLHTKAERWFCLRGGGGSTHTTHTSHSHSQILAHSRAYPCVSPSPAEQQCGARSVHHQSPSTRHHVHPTTPLPSVAEPHTTTAPTATLTSAPYPPGTLSTAAAAASAAALPPCALVLFGIDCGRCHSCALSPARSPTLGSACHSILCTPPDTTTSTEPLRAGDGAQQGAAG
jgi:hypothetical protein